MPILGFIGAGNIGTEAIKQSRQKGYGIGPVVTSSGVYDMSKVQAWKGDLSAYLKEHPEYVLAKQSDCMAPLREADAVFLSIPTHDNGEEACRYINGLLENGRPVITCEKGALSLHFAELLKPIKERMLGYRATVGGGTSMLKYMEERVRPGFEGRVYAIVNGTLNFIFDGISNGRSPGEMVAEASMLGYAEPGAENTLDVVNTEAGKDVPRKSAILFNNFLRSLGEDRFITSDILFHTTRRINPEMMRELIRQAGNRRYIVSIRRPDSEAEDVIGGYGLEFSGWRLEGGFRPISDNPLYQRMLTRGVDNSILVAEGVDETRGVYNLRGPGAGAPPTASAMMRDLEDMQQSGLIK